MPAVIKNLHLKAFAVAFCKVLAHNVWKSLKMSGL